MPPRKKRPRNLSVDAEALEDTLALTGHRPGDERSGRLWDGWQPETLLALRQMSPFHLLPPPMSCSNNVAASDTSHSMDAHASTRRRLRGCHVQTLPQDILRLLPHRTVRPETGDIPTASWTQELTLLHDLPLPTVICRQHLRETGVPHRRRRNFRVSERDITRAVPHAIALSQKTFVTMAFVEWLDRRVKLRFNRDALHRDVLSRYLDGLVDAARRTTCPISNPAAVISLTPGPRVLDSLADLCLEAFVPRLFAEHLRLARRLDGAGLRLDAEFKMAPKLSEYASGDDGKETMTFPYKSCLACRGLRGLYLAAVHPQRTFETGEGYVAFLAPILRQRHAECISEAQQGIPAWMCFDNAPAYELYALAALGVEWPHAVYGSDAPPAADPCVARLHTSLRRDACSLLSDPPHRRWHWQHVLPTKHADFSQFDGALAYALNRISADTRLHDLNDVPLGGHFRLYDTETQLLRSLATATCMDDMKRIAGDLSGVPLQRMTALFRARDILEHGSWTRIFGTVPPCFHLTQWAEALGLNVHPVCGFYAYADQHELQADLGRIARWFSEARAIPKKALNRKPHETGPAAGHTAAAPSSGASALLTGEAVADVAKTADGELGLSLLRWGDAARAARASGLRIPTATTTVESGWWAHRLALFELSTRHLRARRFRVQAQFVALALNYALLHHWGTPDPRSGDHKVLALLDAAYERHSVAMGLAAQPVAEARLRFTEVVAAARAQYAVVDVED